MAANPVEGPSTFASRTGGLSVVDAETNDVTTLSIMYVRPRSSVHAIEFSVEVQMVDARADVVESAVEDRVG